MHYPLVNSTENYRSIQSVKEDVIDKEKQALQSYFWGFSIFTLLLLFAFLSLFNLVSDKKGTKDF